MFIEALTYLWQQLFGQRGRDPPQFINGFDWLPRDSSARSLSTTILGSRGAGKSLAYYREVSYFDTLIGIPQLILDPVGSSAYLLDKVVRAQSTMHPQRWQQIKERIVYLDFSGQHGYVPEWPLLYRRAHESYYQAAQRPIDMIADLDPALASSSIEGLNSIKLVGTHAGMILSILGLQLTELEILLTNPKLFQQKGLFDEVLYRAPEASPSVAFFREQYMKWKPEMQQRRTGSLRTKWDKLQSDPVLRAICGSNRQPPWEHWEQHGMCVIADFSGVLDMDRRRMLMMAVYDQFISYKLSQGLRSPPWSLVFEELTQWLPIGEAGDAMTAKLDTLMNVYARNYQIYVTTICQELFQLPPRLQEVLLAAGNLMVGNQASAEGRRRLAEYFFPYTAQSQVPKRLEPVYQGGEVVDYRQVDWTQAEFQALGANAFVMPGFRFLVKAARKEGDTIGGLQPMAVYRNVGEWVQDDLVAELIKEIIPHSCAPHVLALAEVDSRLDILIQQIQAKNQIEIKPVRDAEDDEMSDEPVFSDVPPDLPPGIEVVSGGFQPGRTSG